MHSSPPWYIVASDERELEERVWKMWISIVLINVLNGCHRFVWEPTSASFAFDSLTDYGEFAILPHYPHGSLFIYALLFWMSSKMPCLALIANIQSQEIIFQLTTASSKAKFFSRRYPALCQESRRCFGRNLVESNLDDQSFDDSMRENWGNSRCSVDRWMSVYLFEGARNRICLLICDTCISFFFSASFYSYKFKQIETTQL